MCCRRCSSPPVDECTGTLIYKRSSSVLQFVIFIQQHAACSATCYLTRNLAGSHLRYVQVIPVIAHWTGQGEFVKLLVMLFAASYLCGCLLNCIAGLTSSYTALFLVVICIVPAMVHCRTAQRFRQMRVCMIFSNGVASTPRVVSTSVRWCQLNCVHVCLASACNFASHVLLIAFFKQNILCRRGSIFQTKYQ